MKDYFAILQVSRGASALEIRNAYRRLAREFHPDLHPDQPAAAERQRELNEAYAVLNDPDRRAAYENQLFPRLNQRPGWHAPAGPGEPYFRPAQAPYFGSSGGTMDDDLFAMARALMRMQARVHRSRMEALRLRLLRDLGWF